MGTKVSGNVGGTIVWKNNDGTGTTVAGAKNTTTVKATKQNQKVGNNTTIQIVNVESTTGVNWDGKVGADNYTSTLTVGSKTKNKENGSEYSKIENKTTVVGGPDSRIANETQIGFFGKVLGFLGISLDVNTSDKKVK